MGQNLILVINAIWPLEYLEIFFFFNPSASNMFFFVCYSIDTDLTFKTKDQCICSVSHYCSSDSEKVKKSGRSIIKTALQKHNNNKTQTNKQEKKKNKRRRAANKTWLCTSISWMGCAAPTCHQKEAAFPLSDMNTGFAFKSSALKCGSLIQ